MFCLKLWYGEAYHQKGIMQLTDYLDIHNINKGFLVVFDDRKKKLWEVAEVTHQGKDISAVWV